MDNKKYFTELARQLLNAGIQTYLPTDDHLIVLWKDRGAVVVSPNGQTFTASSALPPSEINTLHRQTSQIAAYVNEYVKMMAQAPRLIIPGLDEDYRLLADFNGVVLAGHEMTGTHGYQFVTWQWSSNHTSVHTGHYFMDGYAQAKEDFAHRSGLISAHCLFTDEQFTEIYRCVHEVLESPYCITSQRQTALQKILDKIEHSILDLSETIDQSYLHEQSL